MFASLMYRMALELVSLWGVVQLPGLPDEADDHEADDDLHEEATRFQASPRSWRSQLRL